MNRALAVAAVLAASTAAAYDFKKDSTGSHVKWGKRLELVVDSALDSALGVKGARAALGQAVERLGAAAPGLSLGASEGTGGKVGFDFQGGSNRSDVVAVKDWSWDDAAVAITVVTVDTRTHTIIDADIAFNLRGARWAVVDGDEKHGRYDVQNAFTHELGHAVGLAHSQELEAVMYGRTHPGETRKRSLFTDDTVALEVLYPRLPSPDEQAAEEQEPGQGCSTTPGGASPLLLLFGAFALARIRASRAAALGLVLVAPLSARADESIARADKVVQTAMVGKVVRATTLPPEEGVTVLKTELEVQVSECSATPCPATVKLYVPGGTWGPFEQRVGGLEMPRAGATVGISRGSGKDVWVRFEVILNAEARDAFFRANAARTRLAAAQ